MTTETYEGKPCARGHMRRYRSNRKCVACSTRPVRYFSTRGYGMWLTPHTDEQDARRYARLYPDVVIWRAVKVDN